MPIKNIKVGDIVIFRCPPPALNIIERTQNIKKDYIKRCVALAGDKVEIKNKKLFVNDVKQNEDYVSYEDSNICAKFSLFETQEEYQKRLPAILDNYNTAKQYVNTWDYIYEHYLADLINN